MIKTLNFDSIDCVMNYDTILKTNHCDNTSILIKKPISNIKEISLKSIEMPLFFNNIRNSNSSTLFSFKFNYGSYENISLGITMPEVNYTTITLNVSISNALTYDGISIVLYTVGDYNISLQHKCSSFTIIKGILANNILGFESGNHTTSITTTNFYCLNTDNYLTMYITNISGQDRTNVNGRLLSFKIPLNTVNGSVLYYGQSNTFIQTISITDPKFVLTSMHIMIMDRFGFPINGSNAHYSFTLGINCDNIKELKCR